MGRSDGYLDRTDQNSADRDPLSSSLVGAHEIAVSPEPTTGKVNLGQHRLGETNGLRSRSRIFDVQLDIRAQGPPRPRRMKGWWTRHDPVVVTEGEVVFGVAAVEVTGFMEVEEGLAVVGAGLAVVVAGLVTVVARRVVVLVLLSDPPLAATSTTASDTSVR